MTQRRLRTRPDRSHRRRHEDAAVHLRRYCDVAEARGAQRSISRTNAPMLGRSLCMLGRYDEAEPLAQLGRELAAQHDVVAQTMWRQVQALVDAHYGRLQPSRATRP